MRGIDRARARVRRIGAFGVDVVAWMLGVLLASFLHGVGTEELTGSGGTLGLAGLAIVLQGGLGAAGGLYRGRRYGSVDEIVVALLSATGTCGLLAVLRLAGLDFGPAGEPPGAIPSAGAFALTAMTLVRLGRRAAGIRERWRRKDRDARWPLEWALPLAERLTAALRSCDEIVRCSPCGSVRRLTLTVGDVELVAASERPSAAIETFLRELRPKRYEMSEGDRLVRVSARSREGIKVSLKVVPPGAWGSALQYLTGSLGHNRVLRARAMRRGVRLSWGPHPLVRYYSVADRLTTTWGLRTAALETEEEVYARLGLPWIHPTLRTGGEAVDAALAGRLPRPVSAKEIRADMYRFGPADHVDSIRKLLLAALDRGYENVVVIDDVRAFADGETDGRTPGTRARWAAAVDKRTARVLRAGEALAGRLHVLHAVELPVGPGGESPWPEELLERFDLVTATLDRRPERPSAPPPGEAPFARARCLLRMIQKTPVRVIRLPASGPPKPIPGGKRHRSRDAHRLEDDVLNAAARHGVALEVGPRTVGLPGATIRRARDLGVRLILSSDARTPEELDRIRFAVAAAQRGWAEASDVVSTWPRAAFESFLTRRGGSASARARAGPPLAT